MTLTDLIAARQPGHALERDFYLREDIFANDLELLLGRWTCAGHVASLPAIGDWLTVRLGAEEAIVVRGEDGELHALVNVCRHRGSRICTEKQGHAAVLTCPYHAWSYHLDGRLRAAREMPPGFDPAAHALTSLPITIIGGLILLSFSSGPPSLDAARPALTTMADHYAWPSAKIAARKSYSVTANWKLVMENYHECYHCAPAHPEFSVLHTLARPQARRLRSREDSLAEGTPFADFEAWAGEPDGHEVARVMRSSLAAPSISGSRDGTSLAPAMASFDGACVFAEVGFLSAFLAYPDHGIIYRFIPISVRETQMEVIWLVGGDAVEGRDYDVEALTWLWDVTSLADKKIIERNQAGVASLAYRPGPFSLMEPGTLQYVDRYLGELTAMEGNS